MTYLLWAPITLCSSLEDKVTASGVYLCSSLTGDEIVITISSLLSSQLRVRNNRALGTLHASLSEVIWEDLELIEESDLPEVSEKLRAMGPQFSVPEPKFLMFRFSNAADTIQRQAGLRLNSLKPTVGASLSQLAQSATITSSPFAGSHAALFHGYISTGIISQVSAALVLVDARCLDGMEGGLINTATDSIGLVLGPIIKGNGQGRLMAAVPWTILNKYLPKRFQNDYVLPSQDLGERNSGLYPHTWQGVVSIIIRSGNSITWGSGVLISPDIVATNNHVVQNSPKEKLEIWAGSHELRYAKDVEIPLQGLDLVLIRLNQPILSVPPVELASSDPEVGSSIRSVGYGLFMPRATSLPLESRGIVSKNVPGMLVTSAGCWNGSSGGAIFNSHNQLVGIMASNARDNITGEIMPDMSMSIPVSIIKKALNGDKMQTEITRLWRLEQTYKDVKAKL